MITITVTLIQNPALTIALVFPTATIVLSIIALMAAGIILSEIRRGG